MNKSCVIAVCAAALMAACGQPKQQSEEVATSGNPVFEGWYADPEGIIYDDTGSIQPGAICMRIRHSSTVSLLKTL